MCTPSAPTQTPTKHTHIMEDERCVAAALGASDLRIGNENPQIPSGARLTADADADRPRISHLRTHAPSGCARVKKRSSYLSPFEREACARSGLTVRSDRAVRRAMETWTCSCQMSPLNEADAADLCLAEVCLTYESICCALAARTGMQHVSTCISDTRTE